MRRGTRGRGAARLVAVVTAALSLAFSAAPLTGTAQAHEAVTGSLVFGGEAGEYITGGRSYTYTPENTEMFDVTGPTDQQAVGVVAVSPEGERWFLHMAAPYGQKLTPGFTYTDARSWPEAQPEDPQLEFSVTDRSCQGVGSFTVSHVAYGPHGYIREIDATFERYCDGSTVPVRGELHARMPEPPAELEVGVGIDPVATLDRATGGVVVAGTTTCTTTSYVNVRASVAQETRQGSTWGGDAEVLVPCRPGGPVAWSLPVRPAATMADFKAGAATVNVAYEADDRNYPVTVRGFASGEVTLVRP